LKNIFIILITIILNTNLLSANNIIYDSTTFEVRIPEDSQLEKYRNDPEFKYDREVKKEATIWNRIINWLLEKFFKLFSNSGAAPYVRYIIVGILIALLIVKILNTDFQSLFIKSKKQIKIDYGISEQDLNKINIDEMIEKSIKNQDYRLATRYLFLKSLKILTENNIIQWKINKTNSDFVIEIKNTKFYEPFKSLSSVFERIWYGNFDISLENFLDVKSKFEHFNKSINL